MVRSGRHVYQSDFRTARIAVLGLLIGLLTVPAGSAYAMESLDDAALSDVSGAGIALGFEDFRWLTKPTSYFEQMGSTPMGSCSGSGTDCWRRADMRWYGLSMTAVPGNGDGFHWDQSGSSFGTQCTGSGLACPLGGQIANFSPYDNPYTLRAYSPFGYSYDGSALNADPDNPEKTIYEYVAPTRQPYYNFAFWGEIEAGRTGANENLASGSGDFLKTQTLIQGNAAESIFRMFQYTQPGNETFAMLYHSRLRGDFRFSAAQYDNGSGSSSDDIGRPVIFDEQEGLHFIDVDAFIPLGQIFYQAMTLAPVPEQDGNFILEIPRLRDHSVSGFDATDPLNENEDHIRHFYSYAVPETIADAGYITARLAILENTPGADVSAYKNLVASQYSQISSASEINIPESYYTTHGYSRWGDWYPCQGVGCPAVYDPGTVASHPDRNTYNDTSDGIFFRKCSDCEDFDAFAYMLTAVDVRANEGEFNCPGGAECSSDGYDPRGLGVSDRNDGTPGTPHENNGYVSGRYYAQSDWCDSQGDGGRCGYGGSYNVDATGDFQFVQGKLDPSTTYGVNSQPYIQQGSSYSCGWFNTCYNELPAAIPVIRTDRVNIGDARIEGMQINYMKFTSYGAGAL